MNYLILFIVLITSIYFIFLRKDEKSKINQLIPGPKTIPFFGNLIQIATSKKELHLQYLDWYNKYGPIFHVKLGAMSIVVLTGHSILKESFVDNSEIFTSRYQRPNARSVNGFKGLINSNGDYHKNIKSVVLSEMTTTKIKKMEWHINSESTRLCQLLEKHSNDGNPFCLNKYFKLFSINIILRFLFGIAFPYSELDDNSSGTIQVIQNFLKVVSSPSITSFFPFLTYFIKDRPKKFHFNNDNLTASVMELIEKYKRSKLEQSTNNTAAVDGADNNTNLTIMDKLLIELDQCRIDQIGLISIIKDLLVAGTDTVGQTLMFSIVTLINNQDIQEKLYNSINESLCDEKDYSYSKHGSSIPYLSLFAKEIYRKFPVGILGLPHVTSEDVVINGYKIAKGTQIIQNIYATHRSDTFFSNPDDFYPERFLLKDQTNPLITFAVGQRNCLGMNLANAEYYSALATVVRKFKFKNPNPSKPLPDTGRFSIALICPNTNCIIEKR